MHLGFKLALDRVWDALATRAWQRSSPTRSVWFAGHSLGAALAALAADRYAATAGVCTLGAPRVGDWHFAASHSATVRPTRAALRERCRHRHAPAASAALPARRHGAVHRSRTATSRDARPSLHHYFAALVGDAGHLREVRLALDRGHLHHAPDFLLDHMPRGYAVDIWNDYARFGD